MAHEISVTLRADPKPYEQSVDRLRQATNEWEKSTAAGADDVSDRFSDVIRALVDMERQAGRSSDDIEKSLRGIGLSGDDAKEAIAAIDRELDGLKDGAAAAESAGDSVEGLSDKASGVGDSLRDLGSIAKDVLAGDFASAASGALESLGGIAAAAGVGGAVGSAVSTAIAGLVGTLIGEFTAYSEKVKEVRDETSAALVEMAGRFDSDTMHDRIVEIVNDTEKWRQALLIQKETGLELSVVLSGLAGDAEDAATTSAAFADAWDQIGGNVDTKLMYDAKASIEGVTGALVDAPPKVDAVSEAMRRNNERTRETNASLAETAQRLRDPWPDVTVKLRVDDEAVKNWRAPMKYGAVEYSPRNTPAPSQWKQLLP